MVYFGQGHDVLSPSGRTARRERNLREHMLNAVIKSFYFLFIINALALSVLNQSTVGTGLRSKVNVFCQSI